MVQSSELEKWQVFIVPVAKKAIMKGDLILIYVYELGFANSRGRRIRRGVIRLSSKSKETGFAWIELEQCINHATCKKGELECVSQDYWSSRNGFESHARQEVDAKIERAIE